MNIQWHDRNEEEVEWLDFPSVDADLYEVLEVSCNASLEVIKRAYHALASRYHPDKHADQRKAWAEEMMKSINIAYSTLSDATSRKEYDAHRMAQGRG